MCLSIDITCFVCTFTVGVLHNLLWSKSILHKAPYPFFFSVMTEFSNNTALPEWKHTSPLPIRDILEWAFWSLATQMAELYY